MDKRGARILFGCLGGVIIVVLLFFLALLLTQPTCELIIIEQKLLRNSALAGWPKEKAIRSQDKSTLIKISAYLEYNIQPSSKDKSQHPPLSGANHTSPQLQQQQQQPAQQHPLPASSFPLPAGQQQQQPQLQQQQPQQQQQPPVQVPAQASSQQAPAPMGSAVKSPSPSSPQSGFTSQQLANSSLSFNATGPDSKLSEKARFLPLKLDNIEMRKIDDKYSYKLNFNCSTMKIILVKKTDRVFVEKITMELKPESQKKSTCELQLPSSELFATEVSTHDNWAHYYCDEPLRYSCYHSSSKHPGQPGILLAELHINGIEFETSGLGGQANNRSIHKGLEFLGARGKYCS